MLKSSPAAPALVAFCCMCWSVSAAVLHWQHRFSLNPDAVSYFEIARKYLEGDWRDGVNAMWSPLYAWLLLPVIALSADQPMNAPRAAHGVQLACIAFALWTARRLPT